MATLAKMATTRNLVVCNCLCFIVNKLGKTAKKSLKSLIVEFYSNELIITAKRLLLDIIDISDITHFPKSIRRRRDSTSSASTEFDDIIAILMFLDENGHMEKLPMFVADNPNNIPSSKMVEGDLDLLWTRLDRLEAYIKQVCDQSLSSFNAVQEMSANFIHSRYNSRPVIRPKGGIDIHTAGLASIHSAESRPTDPTGMQSSEIETDNLFIEPQPTDTMTRETWYAMSKTPTASESENDGYTVKLGKKKRSADAANISPIDSVLTRPNNIKPKRNHAVPIKASYAQTVGHPIVSDPVQISNAKIPTRPAESRPKSTTGKVIGNATSGLIKAAASDINRPKIEKSVFGVYNVDNEYDVNDIRKQCKHLNIRVLFCFDVTQEGHKSKTFKVGIDKRHYNIFKDKGSWPSRIEVRDWHYKQPAAQLELDFRDEGNGRMVGLQDINN